jgi:hypothetical protein
MPQQLRLSPAKIRHALRDPRGLYDVTSKQFSIQICIAVETSSPITNFMKLSPSLEAASCAATQELPNTLRKPKIYYRVHKSPPLAPILSQIDPVHTIPSYLSKVHFNIVHPPTSWSSYSKKMLKRREGRTHKLLLVGRYWVPRYLFKSLGIY